MELNRLYSSIRISSRLNGRATIDYWPASPYQRGSYSYWKVGQYQAFAGYERVPQGKIYFAGEHTSQDYQGFMEGGASEGVRAATELITQLRGGGGKPA